MKMFKTPVFIFLLVLVFNPSSSVFADRKRLTLIQLKEAIDEYNQTAPPLEQINSVSKYRLWYDKIRFAPYDPDRIYPEFEQKGRWKWLLNKMDKKELKMDELRENIEGYNQKALQIRQIKGQPSYKKYYKYIENAPQSPEKVYPDFEERGGWGFLCRNTCEKRFAPN